jgi:hypothetical protein
LAACYMCTLTPQLNISYRNTLFQKAAPYFPDFVVKWKRLKTVLEKVVRSAKVLNQKLVAYLLGQCTYEQLCTIYKHQFFLLIYKNYLTTFLIFHITYYMAHHIFCEMTFFVRILWHERVLWTLQLDMCVFSLGYAV